MKAIVRACWDVFLLRSGPQLFPRSWMLFGMVSAVFLASDALTFLAQGLGAMATLQETVFDFGLQLLFFALLLGAQFRLPRLWQTLTAWFGAGVYLNLCAIPPNLGDFLSRAEWAKDLWFVVSCLVVAWTMAVMTSILRHALEIGLVFGLIIAAVYTFASTVIFAGLFPG